MSAPSSLFVKDFKRTPYWWEAFEPPEGHDATPGDRIDVAVVGAGYAGVCCALALAEAGVNVVVFESGRLGQGASTRSGGQVSGGVNVQKKALSWAGEDAVTAAERLTGRLKDAAASMTYLESLIEKHGIDCTWQKTGRLTAMWLPSHYKAWTARLAPLNQHTGADAEMIPRENLKDHIGSSIYHGAALIRRGGHLHPARLYGGMLRAAQKAGARFASDSPVTQITRKAGGYMLAVPGGEVAADEVVIATNGYTSSLTPALRRGVIPVTSHMIATEELAPDLAASLLPQNQAVSESRRVVNHYRLSPDGKRLIFGGRARFVPTHEDTTARLLHAAMLERFPQLQGTRITHTWGGNVTMTFDSMPHIGGNDGMYYALGCNGSGVAMMSYLGHSVGRKILMKSREPVNAFDTGVLPGHPLYSGSTWFLFALGTWYQFLDAHEHRKARP